jgi:predicted phage-related endonuclease
MTTTDPSTAAVGEAAAVEDKPTIALPDDAAAWLGLIRQCDQQIKDLEETKQVARKHIEQLLGEHEVGTVDGQPVVRWTVVPSTRLDTTKLKAERPEVYEAFCRTSISRRFTLVDPA